MVKSQEREFKKIGKIKKRKCHALANVCETVPRKLDSRLCCAKPGAATKR